MTPGELAIVFAGKADKITRDHNERMHLAWHIATLPRHRQIPDLRKLLAPTPDAPRRIQSPEEQWAIMNAMAQASKVARKN